MNPESLKSIYFIGIGGIGMSAIARYFKTKGVEVSGYDKTPTTLTTELIAEGIPVHFQPDFTLIPRDPDMVVYTPAVPNEHPELQHFLANEIPVKKRSEVLGMITSDQFTIAVAGSHGKTTVSTMIAHLLKETGYDCTAFLGGISLNYNSNFIDGKNDVVVVEADEFDRSFLQLHPNIAVITSVDSDHLDVYGSKENIELSFRDFLGNLASGGKALLHHSLQNLSGESIMNLTYSLLEPADFSVQNLEVDGSGYAFEVIEAEEKKSFRLNIGGKHNVENALAAIAVARVLGIEPEKIVEALKSFHGISRRFEVLLTDNEIVYIDDYAHHPRELQVLIESCRELYPQRKLTLIFQPHLFSRTADLATEFAEVLSTADEVLVLPIYPARELPMEGVTSNLILEKMENSAARICSKDQVLEHTKHTKIEVLVTAGAGDIDQLREPIQKILQNR